MNQWLTTRRRAWLYSIAASISALALGYDILEPAQAASWLAVAAAVLGIAAPGVALANMTPDESDIATADEPDIEVE
jgi:hypothetical protein